MGKRNEEKAHNFISFLFNNFLMNVEKKRRILLNEGETVLGDSLHVYERETVKERCVIFVMLCCSESSFYS